MPDDPEAERIAYEQLHWRDDAVCAQVGGDLWFPENGAKAKEARLLCSTCPVRKQCLELALQDSDLHFGIWGGKTPAEIRAIRRQRNLPGAHLPDDIEPEDESIYG